MLLLLFLWLLFRSINDRVRGDFDLDIDLDDRAGLGEGERERCCRRPCRRCGDDDLGRDPTNTTGGVFRADADADASSVSYSLAFFLAVVEETAAATAASEGLKEDGIGLSF